MNWCSYRTLPQGGAVLAIPWLTVKGRAASGRILLPCSYATVVEITSQVKSHIKLLPESGLALLALLLLLYGLVQLFHSAADVSCNHSGGVIRLREYKGPKWHQQKLFSSNHGLHRLYSPVWNAPSCQKFPRCLCACRSPPGLWACRTSLPPPPCICHSEHAEVSGIRYRNRPSHQ